MKLSQPYYDAASVILPVLAAALLSACAGGNCLDNASAEEEISPQRVVRVVIVTAEGAEQKEMKGWIEEAFDAFRRQTGIEPVIADWKMIAWRDSTRQGLLQQVADEMAGFRRPYDIAIGVYQMDPLQVLGFYLYGGWMGAIDDVYRKFIVVRRESPEVLVHELGHAFLFERVHSGRAMRAFKVCALGDYLCTDNSICFAAMDQMEIIMNRSRSFTEKPPLKERQDLIEGYTFCKTYLRILLEVITFR